MRDELASLRERNARLELLYEVGNILQSTLDPQETLNLILREAVRLTRASSGSVSLINPTTGLLETQVSVGLPASAAPFKLGVGVGITGWVAKTGQAARVGRVQQDPRYVCIRPDAVSELAIPLRVETEVRGVLNVDSDSADAFSPADQELLEALEELAAKVIQNSWKFEQIRLKARMFEGLAKVSRTINSTLSLNEALQAVARETCALMSANVCVLHLLDPDKRWLDLKASYGVGQSYLEKPRLSAEESLLGVVTRRRKPVQVENIQVSSRYQNQAVARHEGLVSLLSVPLVFAQEAIGTLSVYKGNKYVFSNEEIRVLTALAELSGIAIEKARLYERILEVEEHLRQNEKLSALGLLAAEVAHEIRNPLTVLKMLFHSLKLDFPPQDPRAQDTRIIGEKMDQLNHIVEQILNFARSAEPKLGSVNLNQVLSELALITRHKFHTHNVKLVQELETNLPLVQADTVQLEQAFLNLMLNAIQAMPHGGSLLIRTRYQPASSETADSDCVTVNFTDTGEGMSQAQQDNAFRSLLSSKKKGGTGLGLVVVQRVVESHRGTVRIQSQSGKGTTISISLPKGDERG